MITIAVTNQKGGVGKSTTAEQLTAGLALRGHKCLAVDLDAQGNLSYTMNASMGGASVLGVLMREVNTLGAIQNVGKWDMIASSKALVGADTIITETGKEYRLKEALATVSSYYDYCILDAPPALGILTTNALTAADHAVIPVQADIYSLQGMDQLADTIESVRKYCNPALSIAGVLLTRHNPRTILAREISEMAGQMAASMGTTLFKATIREATAVKESQLMKQSLFEYAPKAPVTEDYSRFIDELLNEIGE